MEENRLKRLFLRLSMTSVFRNVTKKPVFTHFFDYARSASKEEKIASYSAMVSDIYNEGGSLAEYVSRLVFEDAPSTDRHAACPVDRSHHQNNLKII